MTALEIVLVAAGMAFIVVSFFVSEKLTSSDIEKVKELSSDEIKKMVHDELADAKVTIEDNIDDVVQDQVLKASRALERETNEKIMAISEYSDTVMDSINDTHSKVLFMYSMLNDKEESIQQLVEEPVYEAQPQEEEGSVGNEYIHKTSQADAMIGFTQGIQQEIYPEMHQEMHPIEEPAPQEAESVSVGSTNEEILSLYRQGMSSVEIARMLELGEGQVRLVIHLYEGE
jgi:DNA-binding NarL/FixJ family response regulator